MAKSQASRFLARAAELAEEGRFRVEPNPVVGCVLVKRNRVIAEGFHRYWGGSHAERDALRAAGKAARGATAYVTLEPCAHRGKTPPCTRGLIRAGVRQVVYAASDKNPETAGRGPNELREAGIRVRKVRPSQAIREQLASYRAWLGRDVPWVIAKWAMTLDGRIATRTRDSKWITGDKARKWSHRHLRAHADAIVVGAGTVLSDDPALTNRGGRGRQPLRVVVCGRRPLWPKARLLNDGGPTLLAIPGQYRAPKDVESLVCGKLWKVDPRRLLRELHDRGLRRIVVEGGGELLGSFFDAGLVQQVAVFVAPVIVGGISAVQAVGGKGIAAMADAVPLARFRETEFGRDRVIEGYVGGA